CAPWRPPPTSRRGMWPSRGASRLGAAFPSGRATSRSASRPRTPRNSPWRRRSARFRARPPRGTARPKTGRAAKS
ncbi:MAG: hypothetical protein AVDCRST_MAG55-757, partial [uncultured Rubrobacteraceae bacterium]